MKKLKNVFIVIMLMLFVAMPIASSAVEPVAQNTAAITIVNQNEEIRQIVAAEIIDIDQSAAVTGDIDQQAIIANNVNVKVRNEKIQQTIDKNAIQQTIISESTGANSVIKQGMNREKFAGNSVDNLKDNYVVFFDQTAAKNHWSVNFGA